MNNRLSYVGAASLTPHLHAPSFEQIQHCVARGVKDAAPYVL